MKGCHSVSILFVATVAWTWTWTCTTLLLEGVEAARSRPPPSSRRPPPSRSKPRSSSSSSSSSSFVKKRKPTTKPRRPAVVVEEEFYDDDDTVLMEEEDEDDELEVEEDEEELEGMEMDDYDNDEEEDDVEERYVPRSRSNGRNRPTPSSRRPPSRGSPPPPSSSRRRSKTSHSNSPHGGSGSRPVGGGGPRGRVVPYASSRGGRSPRGRAPGRGRGPPPPRRPSATAAFLSRAASQLREAVPDAQTLRSKAVSTVAAAADMSRTASRNLYREMKGLTSSELEQVMLKATRPDDAPVKGKHVERLVGVTYQITRRYDIYDAVLRKLWAKAREPDWRTKVKALYILHRFACDGAPDHQLALKARLRELRRTRDPKSGVAFYSSKTLLGPKPSSSSPTAPVVPTSSSKKKSKGAKPSRGGVVTPSPSTFDSVPVAVTYRPFLATYAHYVLLRAQTFGGTFRDLDPVDAESLMPSSSLTSSSSEPVKGGGKKGSKSSAKRSAMPVTSTALRPDLLESSHLLLVAALKCLDAGTLGGGAADVEELTTTPCPQNVVAAMERVAADLMTLCSVVADTLTQTLSSATTSNDIDPALVAQWCRFYKDELLPKTRTTVRTISPLLDRHGLFLPSRMDKYLSTTLLEKGLALADAITTTTTTNPNDTEEEEEEETPTPTTEPVDTSVTTSQNEPEDEEEEETEQEGSVEPEDVPPAGEEEEDDNDKDVNDEEKEQDMEEEEAMEDEDDDEFDDEEEEEEDDDDDEYEYDDEED